MLDFCNYVSEEVNLRNNMDWLVMTDKVGSFENLPIEILDDEDTDYYNDEEEEFTDYYRNNEGKFEYSGAEVEEEKERRVMTLFFPPERVALEMAADGESALAFFVYQFPLGSNYEAITTPVFQRATQDHMTLCFCSLRLR